MAEKIIQVHRDAFSFNPKFEAEYGKFKLKTNNLRAGKINEFTLADLCFIHPLSCHPNTISHTELSIVSANYIPLDVYHAQALYRKIQTDSEFALEFYRRATTPNIVFLGSVLIDEDDGIANGGRDHYAFLEYKAFEPIISPNFLCYEDNPCIHNQECTIVFNKSVFRKISA